MLNIYFGEMDEAIFNTALYFDNTYLNEWLEDEFAQKMIKDVDKGTVLSSFAIESKALGIIPVTKLSGGTKTLLLIYNNKDKVFNASACGDNCAKWILRIAKHSKEDITINLRHLMDFGSRCFEIRVLNTNTIVRSMDELIEIAGMYV